MLQIMKSSNYTTNVPNHVILRHGLNLILDYNLKEIIMKTTDSKDSKGTAKTSAKTDDKKTTKETASKSSEKKTTSKSASDSKNSKK